MSELRKDVDIFTLKGLYKKVAAHLGFELEGYDSDSYGSSGSSSTIREYILAEEILKALDGRRIKGSAHLEDEKVFVLKDENCHDEKVLMVEKVLLTAGATLRSGCWHFPRLESGQGFDLRVFLRINFKINIMERGFYVFPQLGKTRFSPQERAAHYHMLEVLVKKDKDSPEIAKEIAKKYDDGERFFIPWADFGLCGIREIRDIFVEFAGNDKHRNFIENHRNVLRPHPYEYARNQIFIAEKATKDLARSWRMQFDDYVGSINPQYREPQ